ncbi:sialic acid transporter [Arthrobacter sp. RIT-PI-e]|uniref:siderophore-interacting protein n=1 Tax=Arthrobacter sp. RIT-PI-e TaxID=1681197 RepID=UPI0006760480|nr:siderophore-interacting protein [Arthrobacter sp. RIT-PI-e]KNC18439.1 sialic acid transporter [Arthrobacter sp. RIT-PI-e]
MTQVTQRSARRTSSDTEPMVLAFDVVVTRVQQLGANFRRITFGGAGLEAFGVAGDTLDLRIKVIIPSAGRPCPDIASLMRRDDAGSWYQLWLGMDAEERGAMRTYTVRNSRCRGATPEIDVDFVLHLDDDGRGGPAAEWAAAARPGDAVCVIGPNAAAAQCATAGAYGGGEGRPGLAQHVLLAGAETAVPAISSILESLPEHIGGHAFLEVPDARDFQDIATRSSVTVTWLSRGEAVHGEALDAAVRDAVRVPGWVSLAGPGGAQGGTEPEDVDIDGTILWETPQRLEAAVVQSTVNPERPPGTQPFYAWIAGEAAVVRGLRRYLVRDVGVDRKQVAFMGYWRKGRAELS